VTVRWLAVAVVGATLVAVGVSALLETVEFLLLAARRMAAGTTVGSLAPFTIVPAIAALAGSVLGAHAVDRLVVGAARALQHRRAG